MAGQRTVYPAGANGMSVHGFGRNYLHETLKPLEGEAPVETPEGKEVTIYILLFEDSGYPQHTHYISPHGSLGEAKAAVRKTRFTAKVWKANSDKEWHLSDSAHEGTWIIRESHVRINGE
jgi:hypothetical protein